MVKYYHFTWLQLPFLEESKHTKHILQSFTQYACIESTELNDLRLIICLRKSEVIAKRISVCIAPVLITSWICYHRNYGVILSQSDVIGMPFCQGAKHNDWLFHSCHGNRSLKSSHYDSRGAWHTVYATLLSNYR